MTIIVQPELPLDFPVPKMSEYQRRTGKLSPPLCTCGPCRDRELAKYESLSVSGSEDGGHRAGPTLET